MCNNLINLIQPRPEGGNTCTPQSGLVASQFCCAVGAIFVSACLSDVVSLIKSAWGRGEVETKPFAQIVDLLQLIFNTYGRLIPISSG